MTLLPHFKLFLKYKKFKANGLPERIQISEAFKEALQKHYPEFRVKPRGKVELKASFEIFGD